MVLQYRNTVGVVDCFKNSRTEHCQTHMIISKQVQTFVAVLTFMVVGIVEVKRFLGLSFQYLEYSSIVVYSLCVNVSGVIKKKGWKSSNQNCLHIRIIHIQSCAHEMYQTLKYFLTFNPISFCHSSNEISVKTNVLFSCNCVEYTKQ